MMRRWRHLRETEAHRQMLTMHALNARPAKALVSHEGHFKAGVHSFRARNAGMQHAYAGMRPHSQLRG
jgi:hypothetical protein